MNSKKIYENKQLSMAIILAMFGIVDFSMTILDPLRINENFISVIIYLFITIGIVICGNTLINVLEGAFIKIFKIFRFQYFILYPFTYEVGKIQFRPIRLLEKTFLFNDAYLLNLIRFSDERQIILQKKLFLIRIVSMYITAILCGLIIYYLTDDILIVLIPFFVIILFHVNQHFHWNDWKGDAYLIKENELNFYFLKFTIQDVNEEFLDRIEPLIHSSNNLECRIDFLDRYTDVYILNYNIQVNLSKMIKHYDIIKNEYIGIITLNQVIIYLSLLRIQRTIGIIGFLRSDHNCMNESMRLINEFKTSILHEDVQNVEDFSNMNFNQDILFASGAKRNIIIKKAIKEMYA